MRIEYTCGHFVITTNNMILLIGRVYVDRGYGIMLVRTGERVKAWHLKRWHK